MVGDLSGGFYIGGDYEKVNGQFTHQEVSHGILAIDFSLVQLIHPRRDKRDVN
jgi:hypothetical protein